jgi:hypothetical protein
LLFIEGEPFPRLQHDFWIVVLHRDSIKESTR